MASSVDRDIWLNGETPKKELRLRGPVATDALQKGEVRMKRDPFMQCAVPFAMDSVAQQPVVRIRDRRRVVQPDAEQAAAAATQAVESAIKRRKSQRDLEAEYRAKLRQHVKECNEKTFWCLWPMVVGTIAATLVLLAAFRFNPIMLILGFAMAFLAWKGKAVADFFDKLEARSKERRALKAAQLVSEEVQKKVAAVQQAERIITEITAEGAAKGTELR